MKITTIVHSNRDDPNLQILALFKSFFFTIQWNISENPSEIILTNIPFFNTLFQIRQQLN